MPASRNDAWVVAGFAAALDLALVVCAFGLVSLATDAEVVGDPAVGVLVGPLSIGASVAAVLVVLGFRLRRPERLGGTVLLAALAAWAALVVVAIAGHALSTTGSVAASVVFGFAFGIGWFGVLVPVIAAVAASFAVLVARGRAAGMDRPRWPWERDGAE
ncbi:hypothetical protein FLP10_12480 [Agromyces intestinalis]|uniref:Uncharacterized protein n=1 Tax=Agromyces intestinalis TaxID=2592652 RepID=A0A5C1YJ36_9MICO|nr:DUF6121 family protein [Agromyces intestinalis]QEO15139.1 hypothetical protein FLP10_12480 [Agromyces intestinalis]